MRKQTVLIVHNYYQIPGGEDSVVANEKRMLEEYGHKVYLYTRNNSELKTMGIIQKLKLPFTTIFNFKTYRDIKKIIKEKQIDIVHVHNTLNLISPSVYYAARAMKVPVVQTIHNFRLLCPGATFYRDGHICEDCVEHGLKCAVKYNCYRDSKIQTLACVISTKFHRMTGIYGKINYICLTEFNKEKLLQLKQIKEENVFVKPNYVESVGEFVPEEKRKNQFVFAGRLDKLKGIDFLLKAWKQMGEYAPQLVICGTGPLEDWCKKFIVDNKLNVEILGFLPNSETRKVIANSKALILPTQWYEGFPMSIVEAFSMGTPAICSNVGNVADIVKEGVNGYKFEMKSVNELEKKIRTHTNLYESTLGWYREYYTKGNNYKILLKIYNKIGCDYF